MLLHLSTTRTPATDLGYVLHKHPDRPVTYDIANGVAHVVWPDADERRASCAVVLDIDPVSLVRGARGAAQGPLSQYVNDRPYVTSSLLSVALSKAFRSAMAGKCKDRPELVDTPFPLEIRLDVVASRGGPGVLERLFLPLGYTLDVERLPLDAAHPEWGPSALHRVRLEHTLPVRDVLRHLYVLLPVLDDDKHYWVGEEEVDKLVRRGENWLEDHPEKAFIVKRSLKRQGSLVRAALSRLVAQEQPPAPTGPQAPPAEATLEKPLSLDKQRRDAVLQALLASKGAKVADLGCGEGKLLRAMLKQPQFTQIIGMDVSPVSLDRAEARLKLDQMPERVASKLSLIQGSLTYRDARLEGLDAAACVEVIEHIDAERLDLFEKVVFGSMAPGRVVVTTPNVEYNALFENLPTGKLRHTDHRFEWTREEFRSWAQRVAETFGYTVTFAPIGAVHETLGAPTQMGVFDRCP